MTSSLCQVRREADTRLPTEHGEFRLVAFTSNLDPREHVALVMGQVGRAEAVLVRLHSECLTGDVFGSRRCDCGAQLRLALSRLAAEGRGVLLYLRQEGRGIGLLNKLRAYRLQDEGHDTVEANRALGFPEDLRDYRVAAAILRDLGVTRVRLLTNNPRKCQGLAACGLEVEARVPLEVPPHPANLRYLETKRDKLGHHLRL
jgi:3,4-dihydroxy 2-butanone 4-phosphate synthase/GTP cyclohydrolase II